MGYHRAGFEVVGVDIKVQPRYPFEFHQCHWRDFFERHWQKFDILHASPPCQGYSVTKSLSKSDAPLLIAEVREAFQSTGKPYVIENVPGAKKHMINPIKLRGNQFELKVIRDRLFEVNPFLLSSPVLPVDGSTNSHRSMSTGGKYICVAGHNFLVAEASDAMGIDWMTQKELAQAIPPAYTEYLGKQILSVCFPESIACFGGVEPHSASDPIPPHPQGDAVSRSYL
jgi:DNA (cytosine-5)-methyltransferase 1